MLESGEVFLTREQSRAVDRIAMEEYAIPGLLLMETAGRNAAALVQTMLDEPNAVVTIACGGGNNGGDGYVIARYLHQQGYQVVILATTPISELTPDAKINANIVKAIGVQIYPFDDSVTQAEVNGWIQPSAIFIDALLGTGFSGSIRQPLAAKLARIKAAVQRFDTKVIAIDLPSGMDANTGAVDSGTLSAFATVTFVAQKVGFRARAASSMLGQVSVQGIGIPESILEQVQSLSE